MLSAIAFTPSIVKPKAPKLLRDDMRSLVPSRADSENCARNPIPFTNPNVTAPDTNAATGPWIDPK